jgi:hypothetical protein
VLPPPLDRVHRGIGAEQAGQAREDSRRCRRRGFAEAPGPNRRAGAPPEPSRGAAVIEPLEVGGRLMVDQQARCSSVPRESMSGSVGCLPVLCSTVERGSPPMKAPQRGDHRRQELSGN